uniref:MARVEL domain-containing protein n=1 Tax=Oreochromis aureus TaxID=47969 RepID=A0AAZ1X001_OREAU
MASQNSSHTQDFAWERPRATGSSTPSSGKASAAFQGRLRTLSPNGPCSALFSIVILGCVANEGYVNRPEEVEPYCIFNRNQDACNYGITMGTLGFLCSAAFLALDVYFPQISGVKDRKKAVMADIVVSALWAFIWFVGFCFLANQWQVSKKEDNPLNEGFDAARATIVFSFFSIFTWVLQSLLAIHRFKLGADTVMFNQDYMDPNPQKPMEIPGLKYSSKTGSTEATFYSSKSEKVPALKCTHSKKVKGAP